MAELNRGNAQAITAVRINQLAVLACLIRLSADPRLKISLVSIGSSNAT